MRGFGSPTFNRDLNDWEIEEMTRFFHILHDQQFRSTGVDKLVLQNVKDRGFSVKSMYKDVDVSPSIDFPHRIVWNSVVPPKIGVFAWEAAWGKVLTMNQLKRRVGSFRNRSSKLFLLGKELLWAKSAEKFGLLPRCACFGISGELGICWCLKMRPPPPKGLKLILFPICGLGLIYTVMFIHTQF